jgi:methionine-rich copper-binding protein CopC
MPSLGVNTSRSLAVAVLLGVTTFGGSEAALAASAGPVGISPSASVVARLPLAVSVTFGKSLKSSGASLRVLSPVGDVGSGSVTTDSKTLRRQIKDGAPSGRYTIVWRATSVSGRKMSGSFVFTAARGNSDTVTIVPTDVPSAVAAPSVSGSPSVTEPPASPSLAVSAAAGAIDHHHPDHCRRPARLKIVIGGTL